MNQSAPYPVNVKEAILKYLRCHVLCPQYFANHFGLDSVHYIRPDLPDECMFAMRLGGEIILFKSCE